MREKEGVITLPAPENDAVLGTASSSGAGVSLLRPLGDDERAIRSRLREWILAHSKSAFLGELTDQTPLLESGLISSLDVVELVVFLEELRGAEIEPDEIEPHLFTSVDALWEGFFAARA